MKRIILAIGLALIAVPAMAQPHAKEEDTALKACMDKADDNAAMGKCAVAYAKRQEAALTKAWKRAYSLMDNKDAKKALLDEQRAWVKFNDKACSFWNKGDFGSQIVVTAPMCLANIVKNRVDQLNEISDTLNREPTSGN